MRAALTKDRLKGIIHSALKSPAREALLISAVSRLPRTWQPALGKLVPQPRSYSADDVRSAVRHGMTWELRPSEYFQWHHYFGFDDAVLDTLRRVVRAGDVVVDVGANIGLYSAVLAKQVGESGTVLSLEPAPPTHSRLIKHVRGNGLRNVRCFDIALGQDEGESELHYFGAGDSGKSSLRAARDSGAIASVTVRVRKLDDVWAEQKLERLDLLKVDVEGFEPEVLLGGAETIRRFLPIICVEWSIGWHEGRESNATRALQLLQELGYRAFAISGELGAVDPLQPLPSTDWQLSERNLLLLPPRREDRLQN